MIDVIWGILAVLWVFLIWNALLSVLVLHHHRLLATARKRIALGLPPFPKAPDDGRDNYLDRMGIS